MFIEKSKMSKKAQKTLNNRERRTWGVISPITKVKPSKKAYNRQQYKMGVVE